MESGVDPAKDRRAARAVKTFREVADDFMELHVAAKRKARTKSDYGVLLKRHIIPALGSRRVIDIRRVDVANMHAAISRDAPVAANRAVSLVSAIWEWASHREIVATMDNPARGLERNPEEPCERFLTPDEFSRLGDIMRMAETTGLPWLVDEAKLASKYLVKAEQQFTVADPYAVAAIRLLMLTGARLREILNARWDWIDLSRGVMFLPTSKTGKKPLYLSAAAQSVLAGIRRVEGNEYIIAGAKLGAPRADLKRPWNAIRRVAGLDGLRLHDLRHSFASVGAGTSLGLPILGKLLGHSQPATTARYAHLDADPMLRAAETIGTSILAAMDRHGSGSVVPMRARK